MFGLCSPRGTHFTNLLSSIMRKRVIYRNFRIVEISPESGMWLLKLEKNDYNRLSVISWTFFSICLVRLEMWRHNFKMIEPIEKSFKKTGNELNNNSKLYMYLYTWEVKICSFEQINVCVCVLFFFADQWILIL